MKRNLTALAIVMGLAIAGAIAQAHEPGSMDDAFAPENAILEEADTGTGGGAEFGMWADEHGIRDAFGVQD